MNDPNRKAAARGVGQPRSARRLGVARESLRLKAPFRITGRTFTTVDVIVVTLEENGGTGRGEAAGVYYLVSDPDEMIAQVDFVRSEIESGATREDLQHLLPCGGARNALDCAMWDLDSALSGKPAWALAGLTALKPLVTTFTLGAGSEEETASGARACKHARALKLKLTGGAEDAGRVRAARHARPDVWLGVDANQGYTREGLEAMLPVLEEADVSLIEQPLPRGREAELAGLQSPIPLAADESVQGIGDIAPLAGLFDVINIKLDKCGGLTEGLAMAQEARRHGMMVMVGNMVGTSLAMAPACVLGQLCEFVDLDGPFHLAADRDPPARYENGMVSCPPEVWGAGGSIGPEG